MELTYDWKSFQSVFYPQRRALQNPSNETKTVFAVVEKDAIVATYCDGENYSDFVGASVHALRTSLGGRELVLIEASKVDQWMTGALSLTHMHEQIEFFRRSISPDLKSKVRSNLEKQTCLSERHFLLDTLLGKWGKLLPSAFGVFIRLERAPTNYIMPPELMEATGSRCREYLEQEQDILVLVRAGRMEAFYEPDLSPIGAERRGVSGEVVRYLSEKHSVPVQGISVPYVEWVAWNHSKKPWRAFAVSLKSRNARLYPLRWQIPALLGIRAAAEL